MSHFKRFNDSFISVLDELTLFYERQRREEDVTQHEINYLFVLDSDFFKEDLNTQTKIMYLCFLCNLSCNGNGIYLSIFKQWSKKNIKETCFAHKLEYIL